ncbi:muscarinic acetylcholine receptor M2-like [Stegostoma tigrinum]|uniref:muscarinic acetylcholine receptor M2-like n=1 Tax=Stegostoma tigrinum TaxID=3053191 RepID=UPI00202B33F9|nr:muscarinic acetylcholine receptor M2-like [Stegostoma tigrinum]
MDPWTISKVLTADQSETMVNSKQANESLSTVTAMFDVKRESPNKIVEFVFIVFAAGSLSFLTFTGNILVIISIKRNKHLQTINNYFLLSLACADMILGAVSMNLYTIYLAFGYWPLGPVICDLWLALDHVVGNASSMNIFIISFDRYSCVTNPMSYPVKRTSQIAGIMIAMAWIVPFIVWGPSILFWQFIVGERTVSEGECYVQFLSNPAITLGITIGSFFFPVIIMVIFYVHISLASKRRIKQDKKKHDSGNGSNFPNPVKGKVMKLSNNNVPNLSEGLPHDEQQKAEINHALTMDNSGEELNKEVINESKSFSKLASKEGAMTQEITINSLAHSCYQKGNIELSCIETLAKSQNNELIDTTEGIIKGIRNGDNSIKMIREDTQVVEIIKTHVKKQKVPVNREKKVTMTVLAILLAFIITWTPYFVMLLISTFCSICVPGIVWIFGYWLCYINCTINPFCYALCNSTFKKTFKYLLLCQYESIGATK